MLIHPALIEAVAALPIAVEWMKERIDDMATAEEAPELWAYLYIAMGLHHSREEVNDALQEFMPLIKASRIYESILAVGRIKGAKESIMAIGSVRLGTPDLATAAKLQAIEDEERLDQIKDWLLEASSWEDLLEGPMPEPIIGWENGKPNVPPSSESLGPRLADGGR